MGVEFSVLDLPIRTPGGDQAVEMLTSLDKRVQAMGRAWMQAQGLAIPPAVTKSFTVAGESALGLSSRLEHLAVSGSFALNSLAQGGEQGLTRFAHSVAFLGQEFGPLGLAISTFLAVSGESLLKWFHDAQHDADHALTEFANKVEDLRRRAQGAPLVEEARLAQGDLDELLAKDGGKFQELFNRRAAWQEQLKTQSAQESAFTQLLIDSATKALAPVDALIARMETIKSKLATLRDAASGGPLPITSTATAPQSAQDIAAKQLAIDRLVNERSIVLARDNYDEKIRLAQDFATRYAAGTRERAEADLEVARLTVERDRKLAEDRKNIAKDTHDFLKQLDDEAERRRKKEYQDSLAIVQAMGQSMQSLFQGLFTHGVGGAIKNFGSTALSAVGSIFMQQGEALVAASPLFIALGKAIANPFTSGFAMLAIGAALTALGATLAGSATGGGGSGSYGSYGTNVGASATTIYLGGARSPQTSAGANTAGVTAQPTVHLHATIFGKDDPAAQRELIDWLARAQRRGRSNG